MDLLLSQPTPRIDDAILILETCHKLDPYNGQVSDWIDQLKRSKSGMTAPAVADQIKDALAQVQQLLAQGQTNTAEQILEQLLNFTGSDANTLMSVADAYSRLHAMAKSEQAILRLTQIQPNMSQAWYNLAAIQTSRGEVEQALRSLKKSLDLNAAEIAKDSKSTNLREHLLQDPSFAPLRDTKEFKAALAPVKS
jgi:tetratricopeptide (TPR) repeat protein